MKKFFEFIKEHSEVIVAFFGIVATLINTLQPKEKTEVKNLQPCGNVYLQVVVPKK